MTIRQLAKRRLLWGFGTAFVGLAVFIVTAAAGGGPASPIFLIGGVAFDGYAEIAAAPGAADAR